MVILAENKAQPKITDIDVLHLCEYWYPHFLATGVISIILNTFAKMSFSLMWDKHELSSLLAVSAVFRDSQGKTLTWKSHTLFQEELAVIVVFEAWSNSISFLYKDASHWHMPGRKTGGRSPLSLWSPYTSHHPTLMMSPHSLNCS